MPRKLKTYITSAGFFDLAIAAPSMKAALEAWGTTTNLFHGGFAKEVNDPDVVAATMAKPGIVLRRAVGSDKAFKENAELPTNLHMDSEAPGAARPAKATRSSVREVTNSKAALAFEREEKRRRLARQKEEAARETMRQRQVKAIAAADTAFKAAERDHKARVEKLEALRKAADKKLQAEKDRWERRREKLELRLSQARGFGQ